MRVPPGSSLRPRLSVVVSRLGAVDASGEELDRLVAYSYLSVADRSSRAAYIAIMRIFTGTLLADLSADEVAERLADQGVALTADEVAGRLGQLAEWGDLAPSARTVRVASIAEYRRSRSRFQLTQLGEQVQRHVDEVLATADAAREVSREMLGLVEEGLTRLAGLAETPGGPEPRDALERVTTLFAQFGEFADSIRDFYTYLGQVLFRYDLDGAEYTGFKNLLLDYVESLTEDVAHHAPRIERALDRLEGHLPELLKRIDEADAGLSALAEAVPGTRVRRARGRELDDWHDLRAWFASDGTESSEVDQLREATRRALQALLANAKRMIRSGSGELSRRRDLLKLAKWFDEADDATAHDLAVSAFGLYPARHLGVPTDADRHVPTTVSWWGDTPVEVPVALRERGSRAPRGRTSGVEDHSAQKELLRSQAEAEAEARREAAAELRRLVPDAAGRLPDIRLSAHALRLLQELLGKALAGAGPAFDTLTGGDLDLDLRLHLRRGNGRGVTVHGFEGDLTLEGIVIALSTYDETAPPGLIGETG
ncbi:MAG: TIGR02677 family protein [Streptosporangiales bacterium]|nr:TIGR02677 family protein [Streptosporangiales bacterium]